MTTGKKITISHDPVSGNWIVKTLEGLEISFEETDVRSDILCFDAFQAIEEHEEKAAADRGEHPFT